MSQRSKSKLKALQANMTGEVRRRAELHTEKAEKMVRAIP